MTGRRIDLNNPHLYNPPKSGGIKGKKQEKSIKFKRLDPLARLPTRATKKSGAYDLYAIDDAWVLPFALKMIPLGLTSELPAFTHGLILPRSGLAVKKKLTILNAPGLVDNDYRGQWFVPLYNAGLIPRHIKKGDRIAQVLFYTSASDYPVSFVGENFQFEETNRGIGGFGSTGE